MRYLWEISHYKGRDYTKIPALVLYAMWQRRKTRRTIYGDLIMTKQWKVSFAVSEEDYNRGKKLTRETNVSEELRKAYGKILDKAGV